MFGTHFLAAVAADTFFIIINGRRSLPVFKFHGFTGDGTMVDADTAFDTLVFIDGRSSGNPGHEAGVFHKKSVFRLFSSDIKSTVSVSFKEFIFCDMATA